MTLNLEQIKEIIPHRDPFLLIAGIDKARFRGTVLPGDTLELHVTMTKKKGPIGFGDAVATVNGKKVVTAEISFAVADPAPKSE